jgi:putative exporter of polyketide antibiotics
MFGDLFELPWWTSRISPFFWMPTPFVGTAQAADLTGLRAVAIALFAVALIGFRRQALLAN